MAPQPVRYWPPTQVLHSVHAALPVRAWYLPVGQVVQDRAAPVENVPVAQAEQKVCVAAPLNFPAGQLVHVSSP